MSPIKPRSWFLSLVLLVPSTGMFRSTLPAIPAQSADEAAVRATVERFFEAFQKKDIETLIALWSDKSPEVAATRESLQRVFAGVGPIELRGIDVRKIELRGDKATVRSLVEMTAADVKTAKPAEGFGRINRTLELLREGATWRVWQYLPTELELATSLASAGTDDERKALLGDHELITAELEKALMTQGLQLSNAGKYAQSVAIYQLAGSIAERLGHKGAVANAVRNVGRVYALQANYAQALEYYRRTLKLAEELGDKSIIARALNNLGNIDHFQGNYAEALEYYQKSLAVAEDSGDQEIIVLARNNIGSIHWAEGNYAKALEVYLENLRLAERLGNDEQMARVLNSLGAVHYSYGDYADALEYFSKSLALKEKTGDKSEIARALINMGGVYDAQRYYSQALYYLNRGLASLEGMKDPVATARALGDIAIVYEHQGNHLQALEHHQKSLEIARSSGDKEVVANAIANIGGVLAAQSKYAEALERLDEALKLEEDLGNRSAVGSVLNTIAAVQEKQRNYPRAWEYCQKSRRISEELGDKSAIASTLNRLGSISYSRGDYAQAAELGNQAAKLAGEIGDPEILWSSDTTAGKGYRALNQPDKAAQAFADAIHSVEMLRLQVSGSEQEQQRFFEDKVSPYYEIVELMIDQKKVPEALAYAERAKARVLLDVLRGGRANPDKAMTKEEQLREKELNRQIVSLNTQLYRQNLKSQPNQASVDALNARLQKARLEYEGFHTTLYAAHPDLKAQRAEFGPVSPEQCVALVRDANVAMLEFQVSEHGTVLFTLTRKSNSRDTPDLKVFKIGVEKTVLEDLVDRFRNRVARRDMTYGELGAKLYALLLKPAQAELTGKSHLIVVPDGILWDLPFQALQSGKNHFVVQDHCISYAPSLTALREMSKPIGRGSPADKATTMLLAMGNAVAPQQTLSRIREVLMDAELRPLPQAETQVKMLGSLYGAARSKIYTGTEASEDRLKAEAGSCRILHIATHAVANNSSPMYSHVVLSQAEGSDDDGLLEAWEVMNLDLKADLVVLSACETARGRIGAGEGMIGLSWAFFVAGCPATLVSQWNVDADSTTRLMVEFHRNLLAGMNKAEALRRAELKLLKSRHYSDPFYWAAFVVIGNGN